MVGLTASLSRGTSRNLTNNLTTIGGVSIPYNPIESLSPLIYVDADSGVSTATGGVDSWTDQSGNDNHLVQTTSGQRPAVGTAFNGIQPLAFTEANDDELDSTNAVTLTNEGTFVCVVKLNSLAGDRQSIVGFQSQVFLLGLDDTGDDYATMLVTGTGNGTTAIRGTVDRSKNLKTGKFVTIIGTFDSTSMEIYENYALLAGGDSQAQSITSQTLLLGGWQYRNTGTQAGLDGEVLHFSLYDSKLSDSERIQLTDHLGSKYAHHPTSASFKALNGGAQRYYVYNDLTAISQLTTRNVAELYGQSNAQGQGLNSSLPAGLTGAQTGRYIWDHGNRNWVVLEAGTNNLGAAGTQHGVELSLMKKLYDELSEDVYLVKYAVSGSNLHTEWLTPSGPYYTAAEYRRAEAEWYAGEDDGLVFTHRGVVWIQGESDSEDETNANNYQANEAALFAALRSSVSVSTMRIASAEIGLTSVSFPFQSEVNTGKNTNADADTYTTIFNTTYDPATDTSDGTHWLSAWLVDRGYDAGDILLTGAISTPSSYENLQDSAGQDIEDSASQQIEVLVA